MAMKMKLMYSSSVKATYASLLQSKTCFSFSLGVRLFTLLLLQLLLFCIQIVNGLFDFLHITGAHCKQKFYDIEIRK